MKSSSNSFFKYKSLSNIEFILDALLYERLYASKYNELNDPMEGVIKLDGTVPAARISEWEASLSSYNICCYTRDPENNLMWSHYADGGKGCVIEFELDSDVSYLKVNYGKTPIIKAKEFDSLSALEIFSNKLKNWQYEKEFRSILINQKYLPISVKSLRFGPRVDKEKVNLLTGILACCKPDLKIIYSVEHTIIKKIPVISTHLANNVTFKSSEYCVECGKTEWARGKFQSWKNI